MHSMTRASTAATPKDLPGVESRHNLRYVLETAPCFRPVIYREICTPALSRGSQLVGDRQRRDELSAITLGAQLGRELVGDVPGENDGAVGLIGK